MKSLIKKRKLLPIVILILSIYSCTSYRPINISDDDKNHIQKGDTVKVITKDGKELIFEVTDITKENIIGESQRIPFSEIVRVEKRQISVGKTSALGGGILVGGFLSFIIGVAISLALLF